MSLKTVSRIVCAACFTIAAAAHAITYSAAQHVRVGNKVIDVGDTAKKVEDAATPDKKIPLKNEYGVRIGERWMFDRGNGSWTVIDISDGMVVGVLDMIDR